MKQFSHTNDDTGAHLAISYPASKESVSKVMTASVEQNERSEWRWFELANGDVIFGCFPRGTLLEDTEYDRQI